MNITAQPMRADARRNREQILAAAETAFAEEGLGVPVDQIARRAGVGTGTLYRHFPTKEALFEAVVLEHMAEVAAEAERRARVDPPGQALFDFLGYLAVEGTVKRNLVDALTGAGIDVKSRATESKEAIEAAIQVLLDRAQQAGEVRADIVLADLFGLVMGTCQFAGEHADECSQRRMLAVVCDGLRPPAAPAG
ncbi:MAG: TetR/AcrR family transcriptional regulator [Actinomycetota bacterium]|nr:TetR/AcrR family transcriptional regulator [Actinomycetota bacterium]